MKKLKKKTICFIPIKKNSERLRLKNFRKINGKPLYQHILDKVIKIKEFDKIIVDTDSKIIQLYCKKRKISFIERLNYLKTKTANGNDLLNHWIKIEPEYKYYFQLHVTSPLIKIETIKRCINKLINTKNINSVYTATKEYSWYWFNNEPINFDKFKLTRSQDLKPVIRDITFLYGITKDEFLKKNSRIGSKPFPIFVSKEESVDINENFDLLFARNFFKNSV